MEFYTKEGFFKVLFLKVVLNGYRFAVSGRRHGMADRWFLFRYKRFVLTRQKV